LSNGLFPQTLTEDGPIAALRLAARHSPVQVSVTAQTVPRLPVEIEANLYFICLEAMQNAAKHASAGRVDIDLRAGTGGSLHVEIRDDGVGFDSDRVSPGRGLANLRDRVASVGGRLDLTSDAGSGTRLAIEVPLPSTTGRG
jgi:signal transduction histidine kinase